RCLLLLATSPAGNAIRTVERGLAAPSPDRRTHRLPRADDAAWGQPCVIVRDRSRRGRRHRTPARPGRRARLSPLLLRSRTEPPDRAPGRAAGIERGSRGDRNAGRALPAALRAHACSAALPGWRPRSERIRW